MRSALLSLSVAALLLAACTTSTGGAGGGSGGGTGGGSGGGSGGGTGDAGVFSACGHPGDQGNSVKVGMYCKVIADCPGSAPICTSFQNSAQPEALHSFFCTNPCDPCDPPSVCGAGALCVCQAPGACGCVPQTCAALIPDGGIVACTAGDGGTDGGTCDGGTDGGDGGC